MYSRILHGARSTLISTMSVVLSVFVFGTTIGIIAGYYGGVTDVILMRIADMMVSFPGMVLAIAVAGVMGLGMVGAVIAITLVTWTKYARLARALVLKTKNFDYVNAAKVAGTRNSRIVWKLLFPAVLPTLAITAATDVGGVMLELAALSFLGLGAQATSMDWGYMLNAGREHITGAPWLMIYPGLAIFITVMIFNLFGDSLRDLLDPKNKKINKRRNKLNEAS